MITRTRTLSINCNKIAVDQQLLGDLAAVRNHGERVRDDEDAHTPGQGDPDVGADRLLSE